MKYSITRRAATRVLEIERGRVRIFEGGYDEYRSKRALLHRHAWENCEAFQRRKGAAEHAAERLARLAVRVGTAPPGVKGSRDFYGRKAGKVARTGRLLRERASHEPERTKPWEEQPIPTLDFQNIRRSGAIASCCIGLAKSYDGKVLFRNLDLHIARGARVAVIGGNGTGKTTLLCILTGIETPCEGEVRIGANVQIGYFTQDTENLDPSLTPIEICGSGTLPRTLLACLKVRPDWVNRPARELSASRLRWRGCRMTVASSERRKLLHFRCRLNAPLTWQLCSCFGSLLSNSKGE